MSRKNSLMNKNILINYDIKKIILKICNYLLKLFLTEFFFL